MLIKDLEMTKELSGKDLVAVRGGFNAAVIGGPTQQANQASGFSLVSVNAPTQVFVPTVTQTETRVDVNQLIPTNLLGVQNIGSLQI
jgi:hypothetical protein